jgi:tetraprenyl-beta-curcumene synthase
MFARAACGYWLGVFPAVCRELEMWRVRARAIPDPSLRAHALAALAKRGNMEGAAAFATFAPRAGRVAVVRATVAFQAAYNHLDVLSERPGWEDVEQARALHGALLDALAPAGGGAGAAGAGPFEYGDGGYDHGDGGYVRALVERCRGGLAQLPAWPAARSPALAAAQGVVGFQACNRGDHAALERWARAQTPTGSGLCWWETAAAAGSSLAVHALIAAAAEPLDGSGCGAARMRALEAAYSPWIGALHSLLDQLVDMDEDAAAAQPNLIARYGAAGEAAQRMAWLARRALACAREVGPGRRHALVVAAMAGSYLSEPQARAGAAAPVSEAVLEAFGREVRPALGVFAARRALSRRPSVGLWRWGPERGFGGWRNLQGKRRAAHAANSREASIGVRLPRTSA